MRCLLFFLLFCFAPSLRLASFGAEPRTPARYNFAVLQALRLMPEGGRYATTGMATQLLSSAISASDGRLLVDPAKATPSYCSGATYLVFLGALEQLLREGVLHLSPQTLSLLEVRAQRDGAGVWGRWNANGPGTARLFHELGIGSNFTSYSEALPGDFMKIFWTPEIGAQERGHSVVYLGTETRDGADWVRFWSSNQPLGYGEKAVPKSKIALALFSRLETPANLGRLPGLAKLDPYLASLLKKRSSWAELREMCGF
jgi:hypothetical protein